MNPKPSPARVFSLQTWLTIPLVLAVAGFWLPPTWLWGLNHGAWLPRPLGLGLPLAGLLLVWSPLGTRFGSWLVHWLDPRLLQRKSLAYGLMPVVGAVVFWLLRDRTHMLGDGQTLAVMVARGDLFHGFDFMTFYLVARVYQVIGGGAEPVAFEVFAWLGYVSGAAYLAAAAWSARQLATPGAARILLYGLLVLATPVQLFFGYAEVYAPLCVALLVFLTFFMLYLQGRARLLAVAVSWSIGLFFHLNTLFLAPLLLVALARPPAQDKTSTWRRLLTVVWPALAALVLAGGIYLVSGYDQARLQTEFGAAGRGAGILVSLTGLDGLLTWRHLKDTLNLWLLLAPLPLVLLLSVRSFVAADRRPDSLRFPLWAGSLWLAVLVALVHLKLGAVRDWDLFAPHMVLLVLAGWHAVAGSRDTAGPDAGAVGRTVAVALVLVVPWLVLNAAADRALVRLEAVAADLSPYPRGLLHEQMAYYHQTTGNQAEVARHYRRAGEVCPANLRFHAIYGTYLLNQGEVAAAAAAYDRALAADSTYAYGLKMAVTARVLRQDYAAALPLARRQFRLGYQDAAGAENHAMAAENAGQPAEAIRAYRRAAAMNPSRLDLLERAAGLYLAQHQYGPAEEIFRRLLASDSSRTQVGLGLADAIWWDFMAQPDRRPATENRARLNEVIRLVDTAMATMVAAGNSTASLQAWRDEVHLRLVDISE